MPKTKELVKEFSTPTRRLVNVGGNLVADFSPLDGKLRFPRVKELRFQHFFRRYFQQIVGSGLSVEEAIASASADANVDLEWATRYLKSKRYREWVNDRMAELETAEGITPGYIALKHKLNIEGEIKLNLSQQASLGELGDRIWPKVAKVEQTIVEQKTYSMDDLLTARREVDELEKKLLEAHKAPEKAA